MAFEKVPARLATIIMPLVEREGVVTGDDRYRILTRYTREELATIIGAGRAAVTRAMKVLRKVEAVGKAGRRIVVEDAETLQRIAEDTA